MTNKKEKIRVRIIVPFTLMVMAISLVAVLGSYRIQQYHLNKQVDDKLAGTVKLFDYLLNVETRFLQSQLKIIARDDKLINLWQDRNRGELYSSARPLFEEINRDFGITHFYFIDPDRICFLRVHMQERHGDLIRRHTLNEAATSGDIHSGIELGPLGTFTLRVVYPLVKDGQLIGYLELGEEIEHLTPRMKDISGLDLVFTIDKANLDRERWKAGIDFLGKKDTWNDFEEFVVIDKTVPLVPGLFFEEMAGAQNVKTVPDDILYENRMLRVVSNPLFDADQKDVGRMMGICDITERVAAQKKIVQVTGVIALVLLGVLLVFFYFYTGRIERQHAAYENDLEGLVDERTKELRQALKEVHILSGFLPICSYCKKIRDDQGYWNQIELYISRHSDTKFSHGICEECFKKHRPDKST